ncbi:asparagine synthase-related protein [Sphingomonas oryzagri]
MEGVLELPAGYALTIDASQSRASRKWSPWQFCTSDAAKLAALETEEVHRQLRHAIDSVVSSLSADQGKTLLSVSGGVDSSIVACALLNARHDFECITLATEEAAGDERHYARILASALGVRLREMFEDTRKVDLSWSDSAHLPRPVSRSFSQSADRAQEAAALEIGATSFFHGGAGDSVFCYLTSSRVVADRLIQDGPVQAFSTALDLTEVTGGGLYAAIRGGIRHRLRQDPSFRWPINTMFLQEDAWRALSFDARHAWLDAPHGTAPGKAQHVAYLAGIINSLEGYGRELRFPIFAPLFAQPILELCLSIPSWLWCRGGLNRAIAREAYSDMLPEPIRTRRSKGTPSSLAFRLVEENRRSISERLFDGLLARQHILDLPLLASRLAPSHNLSMIECNRILLLNDVESWLRAWSNKQANYESPSTSAGLPESDVSAPTN